jgi:C_GCAxxG_C_C family probable redox protein
MWETYGLENEDFLWTCIPFMGGISGRQQAPCGAVSASLVSLGLRHRCSLADKERAKQSRAAVRQYAAEFVKSFNDSFGDINCKSLLGIDFSEPGEYQRFVASGVWKEKCARYVEFAVEKLYEFEERLRDWQKYRSNSKAPISE